MLFISLVCDRIYFETERVLDRGLDFCLCVSGVAPMSGIRSELTRD